MSVSQYSNKMAIFKKNRLGHIFAAHVTYNNLSVTIIYITLPELRWTGISALAHHYYYSIANSIIGRHTVISLVVQPCMPC